MVQVLLKFRCLLVIFISILVIQPNFSQMTMHNFTVTDSQGNTHNLYTSYLDQGKTVVIKFFFTTCPPCIAISPQWQDKYEAWGSGNNDVEFLDASNYTWRIMQPPIIWHKDFPYEVDIYSDSFFRTYRLDTFDIFLPTVQR